MKTCTKCKAEKPLDSFFARKKMRDGRRSECKDCSRKIVRRWQEQNRQATRDSARRWREDNPEKYLTAKRQYYLRTAEERREKSSQWRKDNRERANASDLRRYHRKKNDPEFKAERAIRGVLTCFLRRAQMGKTGQTNEVLGYTTDEFMLHMQRQFTKGMSWENYGDWHIDHIIPVSEYVKSGETDPAVINCLTNLMPRWAKENISKGGRRESLL